jgi:hypothetical protein
MTKFIPIILFLLFIIINGCKKAYQPAAVTSSASYLVVEGTINNTDSTYIKLSTLVNIASKANSRPVTGAILAVESNSGVIYPLAASGVGRYACAGLNLDSTAKYRLRITTANNKVYLSDFVPVMNAPAIDTVRYEILPNGIQTYISSHDPQNSVHYYRFDYAETWVIHSKYYSFYKSNGDTVIERDVKNDQIYQCWQSDTASNIVLASTALLSKDVVYDLPLNFIPSDSPKLDGSQSIIISQFSPSANAYSLLVKQHALTSEAYTFWTNLKKNTEQLGGLFDTQPSQISGNIHSVTNPAEPVIGYISAGGYSTKRIFISNRQIPTAWVPKSYFTSCTVDTLLLSTLPQGSPIVVNQENEFFNYNKGAKYNKLQIPIAAVIDPLLALIIGHTGSTPECVDCTLRGTNHQPAFWK